MKAVEEKQKIVTETPQKFKYRIIAEAWKVQARSNTRGARSINTDHKWLFPGH